MPGYDFPNAPTEGLEYTPPVGGQTYIWRSPRWVVKAAPPAGGGGGTAGVSSFNTRTGIVTLVSGDVTDALTFTPYNATNPSGYQTAANVTTTLAPYALTSAVPVASSTTPLMDAAAAAGSATVWSKGDHVHPTDTTRYAATNPSGYQTAAQVTTTLGPYALTSSVPVASSTAPGMDGAAAIGVGTTWARADHVHPVDTSRYAASNPAGYVTAAGAATAAPMQSFNTRTGAVVLQAADLSSVGGALLASPVFTGNPTAPTPAPGDNDTSIATTAFVTAASAVVTQAAVNNVGRNLLHNPLFNVAQRGVGPFTVNGAYTADRWALGFIGGSLSVNVYPMTDADRTAIGDEAARADLGANCVGTSGAGDQAYLQQSIESTRRLSGKTVTVSFWAVAATGTPKLGVNLYQIFGTGGSPSGPVTINGQAVTLSTTWARYVLTFVLPSASGKTLGTNGDDCTILRFWQSSGATNNTPAGGIGVQSFVFALWGVQLEIGSVMTPLEKPDPQQDLAKCQRFFQVGSVEYMGYTGAGTGQHQSWAFAVPMRATPTCTSNVTTSTNISSASFVALDPSTMRAVGTGVAAGGFIITGIFTASSDL